MPASGEGTTSEPVQRGEGQGLRVGLIVNPVAGVGGRLALKGSDDRGLVDAALARGAESPAPARARLALEALPAGADVLAAGGDRVPVVGIPAGVKMHSAVFGVTPRRAGELVAAFLAGRVRGDAPAEVMDID